MKNTLILILAGLICASCSRTEQSFLETKDAYFGLTPPGLIPEVFAPDIVSDSAWAEHCQVAVSPDGKEIYWSAWSSKYPPADTSMKNSEQIYFSEFKDGAWSKPAIADFIKDHLTCLNGGPSFSPDGNRLYFYSTGIEGGLGKKDVWYAERTDKGWSKPMNAGAPLNTPDGDWTPFFNTNGYAYHMGNYAYNRNEKPLKFKYQDGKFSMPDTVIIHPDFRPAWAFFVSPDESYIIFSGIHKDGFGSLDIYVCFKTKDGKWGTPINMGDQINTDKMERFPTVSPDGKYLFFMRHTPGQDFFWVSTDIIKTLQKKTNHLSSAQEQQISDTLKKIAIDFLRSWEPPFNADQALKLFTRSDDFHLVIDGINIDTYSKWAKGVPNFMADDNTFFKSYKHEIKALKTTVLSPESGVVTITYIWDNISNDDIHKRTDGSATLACRQEMSGWKIVQYHGSHGNEVIVY